MSGVGQTSDVDVLQLLRACGPLGVAELSTETAVTPTAVRQRLGRLLAQGLIERQAIRRGRGRPRHNYQLTSKGVRFTGSNFTDLAQALWKEVSAIEDYEVRRSILRRVLHALVERYTGQIEGRTTLERMRSLAGILAQRRVPFSVEESEIPGDLPVLTAHVCPYPELAESDRTVCAMERILFSELLGENLRLSRCRLDGGPDCQFQPS
jgi:DeoR family transcriptional regulator, suf operon transcriptional repressor